MQVGPRTRRNLRALESFDFGCSAADCIQSYVPAASLRIAADDIDKVNRTRYREGRPQGRLSYFQPPASAWPFRSQEAPLRSIQAPANMGYRCYSNLRKAPSCSRLPALVPSLRNIKVYHVNAGGFRRFSETEVVEAARELALHFVERAGPR